ncbi:MAG: acyl-CoA synthetase, partial [Chloroflexi bacterium]
MRNYDETRRDFRWPAPEHFNFADDVVGRWASTKNGEAVAMRWIGDGGERTLTFRHFAERSDRLANALEGLGLVAGDRVLLMLPRVVEWWEAMLGLEKARLVAMPATTLLTPKDIDYRLGAAEASAVITDAANAEKVDAASRSSALKAKIVVGA